MHVCITLARSNVTYGTCLTIAWLAFVKGTGKVPTDPGQVRTRARVCVCVCVCVCVLCVQALNDALSSSASWLIT